MLSKLRSVPIVCLLGVSFSAVAQDAALAPGEAQVWVGAEVEWRPLKRWNFAAAYVLRTFDAFHAVKGHYYYISARRKLSDHFYVDAKLRQVTTPQGDHFRTEFGMRAQQRFGKDVLYFRSAYFHEEAQLFWMDGAPGSTADFWRNRIRFLKDLPNRYSAYVSVESWTRFRYDGNTLRRAAFMTGIRRDLKKGPRISLDYLYQPEFAQRAPRSMNAMILGVGWDVTKRKKKGQPGSKSKNLPMEDRE